ncbi:T6SS effector phospholipase Tle3 domain-containing protein [Achromobacter animicus]|uniref:T6SS effector phospholipase Tle3 domain-containing protein n=1 Tax=Achromobacter animicus TaxID=1389935 RepID=UPI0028A81130|nr:DUF3274 domain-containing protein [Achromobacter animicus]
MTHHLRLMGQTKALVAPDAGPAYAQIQQPKPCIVILIHGVNDLAGSYADQEEGICEGLNERLDHLTTVRGGRNMAALNPAIYTSPKDDNGAAHLPDVAYYRRLSLAGKLGGRSRSVVIPFYWGFREEDQAINKRTTHGEWLDRFGNRLDKDGIKQGGMFANATTNIPDMFGPGFSGRLLGAMPINPVFGSPSHPLMPAPGRRYMVLAALRLAALVKTIRGYKGRSGSDGLNDTINVVGHSQGTLITLLANAYLKDEGERPIDALVMMSSPYNLVETFLENTLVYHNQQTTLARLQTLANITQFLGSRPNTVPAMADMADPVNEACIGGLRWTGDQCGTTLDGQAVRFTERDNRGNVYLYFSPEDQTVGMSSVQGIGWQGVANMVSIMELVPERSQLSCTAETSRQILPEKRRAIERTVPALAELGSKFFQRVFTIREREAGRHRVGMPPAYTYELLANGESTWEGTALGGGQKMAQASFATGQTIQINAPALPRAFEADFGAHGARDASQASGGIAPVYAPDDPIDASIAVTNGGINHLGSRFVDLPESAGPLTAAHRNQARAMALAPELEAQLTDLNDPARNPYKAPNNNAWAADWHRITFASYKGGRRFWVNYQESPNEARRRRMNAAMAEQNAYSFHSAIPMNKEHSRRALAYDLALGQARSIDDEEFYTYLCRVADWRLGWEEFGGQRNQEMSDEQPPDAVSLRFYNEEPTDRRALINDTDEYRKTGLLPMVAASAQRPTAVISQTVGDVLFGRQSQSCEENAA